MKIIIFLFISLSAFAKPVPIQLGGTYVFRGDFELASIKDYIVVYTSQYEGQQQLKKLIKDKYECWNKGRETFLCGKILHPAAQYVQEIADKVKISAANYKLAFKEKNLIAIAADNLIEYELDLQGDWNGLSFDYITYLIDGDLHKFILRNRGITNPSIGAESFLVNNSTSIDYPETLSLPTEQGYRVYLVLINLRK